MTPATKSALDEAVRQLLRSANSIDEAGGCLRRDAQLRYLGIAEAHLEAAKDALVRAIEGIGE